MAFTGVLCVSYIGISRDMTLFAMGSWGDGSGGRGTEAVPNNANEMKTTVDFRRSPTTYLSDMAVTLGHKIRPKKLFRIHFQTVRIMLPLLRLAMPRGMNRRIPSIIKCWSFTRVTCWRRRRRTKVLPIYFRLT